MFYPLLVIAGEALRAQQCTHQNIEHDYNTAPERLQYNNVNDRENPMHEIPQLDRKLGTSH